MKKLIVSIAFLALSAHAFAQNNNDDKEPKVGWSGAGTISLLFNQAAFNNEWQGGGTSNYAGNLKINYNLNYRKEKLTWDNTFLGDYGLTKTKNQDFIRKTSDRLEVNSVAGYQVDGSNWFYSFFANFKSQFTKGYKYEKESGETVRNETTHFLSPGYLEFGPGMLWKKSDNLKVNIAPATARFIFVDDRFTTVPGYEDGDYYGVDQGATSRFEFGASIGAYYKVEVVQNVTLENTLSLYSNYLEDPQNIDLDYTMNLDMKINDYLSANFLFQAIYDDNAVKAFQVREVLGVGFNYKI